MNAAGALITSPQEPLVTALLSFFKLNLSLNKSSERIAHHSAC